MYCAKGSIILMFHRIIPFSHPEGSRSIRVLLPLVVACAVTSLFLVAFQCRLPSPWILNPLSCSTQGKVHYVTAAINITTDLIVGVWIIPAIWRLQMERHRKLVIIFLLASRIAVCACDAVRIVFISQALQSVDSTCKRTSKNFKRLLFSPLHL